MHYDKIQWSISLVPQDLHGTDAQGNETIVGHNLYAAITPVINGQAIETNWVFDTVALLTRRSIGCHAFDLFTCTCGVAGCAGIHDELYLRVSEKDVELQIPREDPFIKLLVPKYFESIDQPFIWTFETREYQQACDNLIEQLQALEVANSDTPISLWLDDERSSKDPVKAVAIQLANARKWFAEGNARTNDQKAYLGTLYHAHMSIEIEDAHYNLSIHGLFDAVGNTLFGVPSEDEIDDAADALRAQWLNEQIVYFRQNPDELIALFKSLPWDSFQEHAYLFHADAAHLTARLAASWPYVAVAFVPAENFANQDWTKL